MIVLGAEDSLEAWDGGVVQAPLHACASLDELPGLPVGHAVELVPLGDPDRAAVDLLDEVDLRRRAATESSQAAVSARRGGPLTAPAVGP